MPWAVMGPQSAERVAYRSSSPALVAADLLSNRLPGSLSSSAQAGPKDRLRCPVMPPGVCSAQCSACSGPLHDVIAQDAPHERSALDCAAQVPSRQGAEQGFRDQ